VKYIDWLEAWISNEEIVLVIIGVGGLAFFLWLWS
jgi:hypothetical protein